MFAKISITSRSPKTYHCKRLTVAHDQYFGVAARHAGIPGFRQDILSGSRVVCIGAGGIGSEIGEGLAREGVKSLDIFDPDTVEPSNLNRQFFTDKDLYQPKALCLAKNLSHVGFLGTTITGYPQSVQDGRDRIRALNPDFFVCGVDNDAARVVTAEIAIELSRPAVVLAVSGDGDQGYVFVQLPSQACFGCCKPNAVSSEATPCPGAGATKEILKATCGLALFAISSTLMSRERAWNYRLVRLAGCAPDIQRTIERNPTCPLCGNREEQ